MAFHALEIDAWNGAAVETLRFADRTFVTPAPANLTYLGVIADLGSFEASIFDGGGTLGAPTSSLGSIVLDNVDGALDRYLDYGFDGRAYRLYRLREGAESLAGATLLASGLLAGIDTGDALNELRLRLRDARAALETPLLTARYAGTTTDGTIRTFQGDETLKDQIVPIVYGGATNMLPKLVNRFHQVWQVSGGAVASIKVHDGGVPLDLIGDYPTPEALLSADFAAEAVQNYATCLAHGLFRLDDAAEAQITADVLEYADVARRRVGSITGRILQRGGAVNVDTASLAALDATAPAEIELLIDDERDVLQAAADALASIGAALIADVSGRLSAIRIAAPSGQPVATFGARQIEEVGSIALAKGPSTEGEGVPAREIELTWGRVWQVQAEGDLAGAVTEERRAYVKEASRKVVAESAAVRLAHPLAPKLTFETLLTSLAAATAEVQRRLAIYSRRRDYLSVTLAERDAEAVRIGDIVRIALPRFGWDAGKLFLVVGRGRDFTRRTITLSLWG